MAGIWRVKNYSVVMDIMDINLLAWRSREWDIAEASGSGSKGNGRVMMEWK